MKVLVWEITAYRYGYGKFALNREVLCRKCAAIHESATFTRGLGPFVYPLDTTLNTYVK